MDFDFDNLNPSARFFFNDVDEKQGFVDLRVVPPDKLEEINKQTNSVKVEYKRGGRFEVPKHNKELWNKLFWDYVITAWKVTNKGKTVDCTADNKVFLMGQSVKFAGFVSDKLEILSADQDEKSIDTAKN